MKRIFKFSLIALMVGFTACEDAYNIVQESELSEEVAFQTVDDLASGMSGAYAMYNPDSGSDVVFLSAVFTDEIKRGIDSNGSGSETYNFLITPLSPEPNAIWTARYFCINRINRVLRNFDRVVANAAPADVARANNIKGQLHALRALCHFDIYQYFTPELQNPNSPSAIIMDFVPDIRDVFPRNNAGEVVSFILSDLDVATSLLGTVYSPDGSFYLTPEAVDFIRAKVLLYSNSTGNSADVEAIAFRILQSHPIADFAGYEALWQDDLAQTDEDIWTIHRPQGAGGVASIFYANETNATGAVYIEMSFGLFDLYSANDIRGLIWLDGTSTPTNLFLDKYPGSSRGLLTNHFKAFRSAEMALVLAEARARQGNFTGAEQAIMLLRNQRIAGADPANFGNSLQTALTEILLERRKELAFEGHRYIDLKRIGREIGVNLVRDSRDCTSFSAACSLPTTDYRFTMPIPTNETNPNPGIQQNPQY